MRRLMRFASTAGLCACWALGGLTLAGARLGYEHYVVTGRSMTGSIDRGSLVVGRRVPVGDLRVGDVLTYVPPATTGILGPVTHRIVWIGRDDRGDVVFRTKGDANRGMDPWRFTLPSDAEHARPAVVVPAVGYAFAALGLRWVRMLVIGLPALAVGLAAACALWRDPEPRPARA